MNINSKAFAKPKLTKRQRKAVRGDNHAIAQSRKNGVEQLGGYIGANPVYADLNAGQIGKPSAWAKVQKGVPWVRA